MRPAGMLASAFALWLALLGAMASAAASAQPSAATDAPSAPGVSAAASVPTATASEPTAAAASPAAATPAAGTVAPPQATSASATMPSASPTGAASAPPGLAPNDAPALAPIVCPPAIEPVAAPTPPVDRGLLWRLTRDGRRSYLYGTLHVGKPAWRLFGPRIAAAWRDTDVLALELDPTDPAVMAALSLTPPAPPLPVALRARLAAAVRQACLGAAALAALHPVMQATTLTILDARWLGLDPSYSMETLLAERAHSAHRRIFSLESAELQMATLVPADAHEVLVLVDQALTQLADHTSRRVLARLVAAWEQGDLTALEHYDEWCECATGDDDRAFMRRLNDERNPHLAERISALARQGRRVFAAVGVLHMTGPQALPKLLAARGFRVERLKLAP